MSSSSVAIVILNYNGKKHLETFLPSVLNTLYVNAKVVIADNGSTDDSISFLTANYPTITCLQRETNEGFAGGYNWALSLIDAEYYVLLNSDVEVTPNWLEPMVSLLDNNKNIVVQLTTNMQMNYLVFKLKNALYEPAEHFECGRVANT